MSDKDLPEDFHKVSEVAGYVAACLDMARSAHKEGRVEDYRLALTNARLELSRFPSTQVWRR